VDDEGSSQTKYLSVRETARRLGVHENTVRNWAREGILPTARVPGSKFHRFDARDVDRLRRQRGASVASVESERSRIGPELIDATQLSHWAATPDAQGAFPELLRRLLAGTPGVTNISVRTAEGVALPGWDGFAESAGTSFLPSGALCFELGVGAHPKAKADADYAKRSTDPAGVDPTECVFVFATPRRWSGAGKWASEKRAGETFKDVRVLDADDLGFARFRRCIIGSLSISGVAHATPKRSSIGGLGSRPALTPLSPRLCFSQVGSAR
jgi:excisionase family DNA binding protein